MGLSGDRKLKKLKSELESSRIGLKLGPRVEPDRFEAFLNRSADGIYTAGLALARDGRLDVAIAEIERAKMPDGEGIGEVWNDLMGQIAEKLRES